MTGQGMVISVKGFERFSAMGRCTVLLALLLTTTFISLTAVASESTNHYGAVPLFSTTVANESQKTPVSIPVKALVERVLALRSGKSRDKRSFRYDIDSLGYGVAVRMRVAF